MTFFKTEELLWVLWLYLVGEEMHLCDSCIFIMQTHKFYSWSSITDANIKDWKRRQDQKTQGIRIYSTLSVEGTSSAEMLHKSWHYVTVGSDCTTGDNKQANWDWGDMSKQNKYKTNCLGLNHFSNYLLYK